MAWETLASTTPETNRSNAWEADVFRRRGDPSWPRVSTEWYWGFVPSKMNLVLKPSSMDDSLILKSCRLKIWQVVVCFDNIWQHNLTIGTLSKHYHHYTSRISIIVRFFVMLSAAAATWWLLNDRQHHVFGNCYYHCRHFHDSIINHSSVICLQEPTESSTSFSSTLCNLWLRLLLCSM